MATTKYALAEQVRNRLNAGTTGPNGKFTMQEVILAVHQAFGSAVKSSYFMNKNDGVTEMSGTFVYSFKNQPVLFDNDLQLYYSVLPSSYIDLPNEAGITYVSSMQTGNVNSSQTEPMIRVFNNFPSLSRGLAVAGLQTRRGFYTEGVNIYYIGMTESQAELNVLMKLAVSLEGIGEDTPINIPPEMQETIINDVFMKFSPELQIPRDQNANKL